MENDHYLVECKYENDYWYRVHSDGWIEQGGLVPFDWNNRSKDYFFAKSFKTKIVTFLFSTDAQWSDGHVYRAYASNLTGFKIGVDAWDDGYGLERKILFSFYACGF